MIKGENKFKRKYIEIHCYSRRSLSTAGAVRDSHSATSGQAWTHKILSIDASQLLEALNPLEKTAADTMQGFTKMIVSNSYRKDQEICDELSDSALPWLLSVWIS
ncbi:hypothetical protein RRG08_037622 [Elysia crispata]|uniref:Uncharacterized protein n=1 Tax=Elysia crispata TaxID=231223 RepID=A0AAE1CZ48_9GAST|nr:hypothetical protein RRG08_037622 [Elysia crispata]